jgi:preprotein translocase subunit Sec63
MPMGATRETDWREHFFQVRPWFFAMLMAFTLLATLQTHILLGVPLTHPYRILQATVLVTEFVGMVSTSPRVQPWLPVLAILSLLAGQVLFRLLPGLA